MQPNCTQEKVHVIEGSWLTKCVVCGRTFNWFAKNTNWCDVCHGYVCEYCDTRHRHEAKNDHRAGQSK